MIVLDEPNVLAVIRKHERDFVIRGAIERAWNVVTNKYEDLAWFRRKATRANIVWEYAVQFLIEALAEDDGVRIIQHHDTVSFVFDCLVLVRFKKADLQLSTRNYPTQAAMDFDTPEADLFGFEGVQRVKAAYVLNRFETDIEWVGIVAHRSSALILAHEIGTKGEIAEFPILRPEQQEPAASKVLKKKPTSQSVGGGEGSSGATSGDERI